MRKVLSGSLVAAALGTAVMITGALPASAQISNALATGDNGGLLTLARNDDGRSGGGNARIGSGGGGHISGGSTMRSSGGLSARAQADVRDRGDRRRVSGNNNWSGHGNWNNNWRWRHRGHGGVGIGLGVYGYDSYAYDAPYYAYAPGGYDDDDAVSYCMSRFQSYDPGSGTYLGYDGLRHPCP